MPVIIQSLDKNRNVDPHLLGPAVEVSRRYRHAISGGFEFSQGRKLVASPFQQSIGISFTKHVAIGFLIQFFKRVLLCWSDRAGRAPFLPELCTVRFALNSKPP